MAPVYEPSAFARRYEEHKRACGWYADVGPSGASTARWFPRLFEWRDYALYETLMEPYATRLASELTPASIDASWKPYAPSDVDLDPIWPHQR